MKKSKRAMLPQEVLKIILAVICIVLLFYLAVKLYGIFTVKTELEQAKAVIEAISGKAGKLGEGEQTTYLVTNPKNWFFVLTEIRTICNAPEGEKCLCLCADVDYTLESNTLEKCKNNGVCKSGKYLIDSRCVFNGGVSGKIKVFLQNCISLETLPLNLIIKNEVGSIYIQNPHAKTDVSFFEEFLSYKKDGKISIKEKLISFQKGETLYDSESIKSDIKSFLELNNISRWLLEISVQNNIILSSAYLNLNILNQDYTEQVYSFKEADIEFNIRFENQDV